MASFDEKIDNLEHNLADIIEHIRLLGISVCDFQPQSQNGLNQRITSLISSMQQIQKSKSNVQDIKIPLDLIAYIDKGLNPELYIKDYMDKCLFKNEEAKNRVETFKKFKNNLLKEIATVFPAESTKYSILRNPDTSFQI